MGSTTATESTGSTTKHKVKEAMDEAWLMLALVEILGRTLQHSGNQSSVMTHLDAYQKSLYRILMLRLVNEGYLLEDNGYGVNPKKRIYYKLLKEYKAVKAKFENAVRGKSIKTTSGTNFPIPDQEFRSKKVSKSKAIEITQERFELADGVEGAWQYINLATDVETYEERYEEYFKDAELCAKHNFHQIKNALKINDVISALELLRNLDLEDGNNNTIATATIYLESTDGKIAKSEKSAKVLSSNPRSGTFPMGITEPPAMEDIIDAENQIAQTEFGCDDIFGVLEKRKRQIESLKEEFNKLKKAMADKVDELLKARLNSLKTDDSDYGQQLNEILNYYVKMIRDLTELRDNAVEALDSIANNQAVTEMIEFIDIELGREHDDPSNDIPKLIKEGFNKLAITRVKSAIQDNYRTLKEAHDSAAGKIATIRDEDNPSGFLERQGDIVKDDDLLYTNHYFMEAKMLNLDIISQHEEGLPYLDYLDYLPED